MFKKILIANRGEIAIRVMRTCREMGIRSVAVYSEADRQARHVREADEAYYIGPAPAAQSYLVIERIIEVARQSGAEAIHPGYGFLSENPAFAAACEEAGIVFIGPPARAMQMMGSKIAAKQVARSVDAPTVPGYLGESQDDATLLQEANRVGFPLLIKASAGGGGKGMREVHQASQFLDQLAGARREAKAAFGDDTVFLEKLLIRPRHIEIQVLADRHGNLVHLGERDCSIQRRHQKIVEESPSVAITPELRDEMGAAAVRIARAAGYVNAGTVEFIADEDRNFYFLEMNTRLQVEHPVTEQVTGLDLVRHQILIAAGEPLGLTQPQIRQRGHAIEVRLYAEDPRQNYLPSTGTIEGLVLAEGPGVRNDSGVETGDAISPYYDSMIAKLIVYGENREAALDRLRRSLEQTAVFGITTNLPLLLDIARHPAFRAGQVHTGFLAEHHLPVLPVNAPPARLETALVIAALYESQNQSQPGKATGNPWQTLGPWRMTGQGRSFSYRYGEQERVVTVSPANGEVRHWQVQIQGGENDSALVVSNFTTFNRNQVVIQTSSGQQRAYVHNQPASILVSLDGEVYELGRRQPPRVETSARATGAVHFHRNLTAPMAGMVVKVAVQEGDEVEAQQVLVIMEAMKMELNISAPQNGKVSRVTCKPGIVVEGGVTLIELE